MPHIRRFEYPSNFTEKVLEFERTLDYATFLPPLEELPGMPTYHLRPTWSIFHDGAFVGMLIWTPPDANNRKGTYILLDRNHQERERRAAPIDMGGVTIPPATVKRWAENALELPLRRKTQRSGPK